MTTRDEILKYSLSFEGTYMDEPFHDDNWQLMRLRKNKHSFVCLYEWKGNLCINVKVEPEWRDFWRNAYEAIIPGYHQNKEHWNTIILNGTVPTKDIKRMIAESYDIVVKKR